MRGLFFPLWVLVRLIGKRRRKRSELEEKRRKYVRNFSPGRLKNVNWQKGLGRIRGKGERKENLVGKKTNNFSGGLELLGGVFLELPTF